MTLFEPLTANITIAIEALKQLHIDWHTIWKAIFEAGIKFACESKLDRNRNRNRIRNRNRNRNLIRCSQSQQ
ncbi:MAG: hypothetical protein EZS28_039378 [Streblomastix strix]|uniref:Uncharacterized protein n=1 Tax=Streblomastix strix TaxID=222440 RepID=A0A5J4U5X3_9EUKA|nr:MAG: hypothetical protein EZS28_039378 [Streblomastix strix]